MPDAVLDAPVPPRRRFGLRAGADPHDLVVRVVAEHAESLLRVARRRTACEADAEDAYQRALEIFVRSAHRLDPETAHKWLHTVVKREAWAVREQRGRYVGVEDDEALDALGEARHVASVEERSERFEDLARAAEALKRLKAQEITALVLKAQGLSYDEIAERQGWTYTKVNRCLAEGRRAFLARYAGIEAGAECRRWAPVLSALADGEATARQLADARPHLRNCAGCRATLAAMRAGDAAVRGLVPPVALPLAAGAAGVAAPVDAATALPSERSAGGASEGGLCGRLGEAWLSVQERAAGSVARGQAVVEAATAGKLAAATASVAVLAGGGAVAERELGGAPARAAGVERTAAAPVAAAPGGSAAPRRSDPRPAAVVEARRSAAERSAGEWQASERHPQGREPAPSAGAAFAPEVAQPEPPRGGAEAPPERTTATPPSSQRAGPASASPAPRPGGEFRFEP